MGAEVTQVSAFTAVLAHALCLAGLAAAHSLAGRGALLSDPAHALRLLVVCEAPLVIVVFSLLRRDPKRCSFLKAAARGLLGLPIGLFSLLPLHIDPLRLRKERLLSSVKNT
uniref:Uncharacterized protein n=1 Tax=Aegilops tauschii subsp. strangulata TaxID=200361 RepID=A0A453J257_AEGTS